MTTQALTTHLGLLKTERKYVDIIIKFNLLL